MAPRSGSGAGHGRGWLMAAGLAIALPGCAALQARFDAFGTGAAEAPATEAPATEAPNDSSLYRTASAERDAYYEREIARLHADLEQAEQQLILIESGLRSAHTRADAVSAIADARIALARASNRAPWRTKPTTEAREKLAEAERQLEAGHSGSAVFFASRASRIAATIDEEAQQVERHADTHFVDARRANLRSGPSTQHPVVEVLASATPVFPERHEGQWVLVRTVTGPVGWIHSSLLRPR